MKKTDDFFMLRHKEMFRLLTDALLFGLFVYYVHLFAEEITHNVSEKMAKNYTCEYAGLWCTCYLNGKNGCSVSCSPTIRKKVYNQTSCPPLENFVLAGFH